MNKRPLAYAIAAVLSTGALGTAEAARPFGGAWFAARGAIQTEVARTGRLPNGMPASSLTNPQQQSAAARQQMQRSLNNLNMTANAIAARQAAQAAARRTAQNGSSNVPDGLAEGGLEIDTDSLTKGWINANAPQQTTAGGKTNVSIKQTADKAILNWETFNVGRNTTVDFDQQANWAVLNRINDPAARPSEIQGQIKGNGTVLIANRNGVIFSGTSQVNVRNLVVAAAHIEDGQFRNRGVYGATDVEPTFTDAFGKVEIEAGAQITTAEPQSATQGGGYVLLVGHQVRNDGTIITPHGQATLAAGDTFLIRKGAGTDTNSFSTTRGNEVAPQFVPDSGAGKVENNGLILAPTGDITLTGRDVVQNGVAISTTTVSNRGTIHLLTPAKDAQAKITLGKNATTAILLEENGETALDGQRNALIKESAEQDEARRNATVPEEWDNLSRLSDRRDQSRVEIQSGGTVEFQSGSLTLATGGQIAATTGNDSSNAGGRVQVNDGAQVDVAGAVGVTVAMDANNIKINIQGNEQRDAPVNRDGSHLNNSDVWVDRRTLIFIGKDYDETTNPHGYKSDRWYTGGGLLEVGGYVDTTGHSIGEWAASGGTITLAGKEVVTQRGSVVNLSGGTLDVQSGHINQSWVRGADGRLYEVSRAPGDLLYTGLYRGFEDVHVRWGQQATRTFYNPLIGPRRRYESGYTVGRNAGQLRISAPTAVLEGEIQSDVYIGPRQDERAQAGLDAYQQSQFAMARRGSLAVGRVNVNPMVAVQEFPSDIRFGAYDDISEALSLEGILPAERVNTIWIDAENLNSFALGELTATTDGSITVEEAVELSDGGAIELEAPVVDVAADLVARSGSITLVGRYWDDSSISGVPSVAVRTGATLDARGRWGNMRELISDRTVLPWLDGGRVFLRTAGDMLLETGSVIDVSSGAAMLFDGSTVGGQGGNVSLTVDDVGSAGTLTLDGTIRALGVVGAGSLDIVSARAVVIGGELLAEDGYLSSGEAAPTTLKLAEDLVLQAGDVLPVPWAVSSAIRSPGSVLAANTPVVVSAPFRITGDWELAPANTFFRITAILPDGTQKTFSGGNGTPRPTSLVPAGSTVISSTGQLPSGYLVPDVFEAGGLPVAPYSLQLSAGSVLTDAVVIPVGSLLPKGTLVAHDVAVERPLELSPDLFQSGFSSYSVNGREGLVVKDGTQIAVTMPVYRFATSGQPVAASDAAIHGLEMWTDKPLYQFDPRTGAITQREGASLALASSGTLTSQSVTGSLFIGEGASLEVDPTQSISLTSSGQLTVEGTLRASGGSIALTHIPVGRFVDPTSGGQTHDPQGLSIWIGDDAILDAAAAPAFTAIGANGRLYSALPHDGGAITLQGDRAFVIVRPGAVVDASGTHTQVYVPDARSGVSSNDAGRIVDVASHGGSITISSQSNLYLDGSLRAAAGGAGAAGGLLDLTLSSPIYALTAATPDRLRVPREIVIGQTQGESALPMDLVAGEDNADLLFGRTRLGVDTIQAGGFDRLGIEAGHFITFDGDVSLELGQSLALRQGTVSTSTGTGHVNVSAPYVLLSGTKSVDYGGSYVFLLGNYGSSTLTSTATLEVNAGTLDVQNALTFGRHGTSTLSGSSEAIDRAGFEDVVLSSQGDIRFLTGEGGGVIGGYTGSLRTSGNLVLEAEQIYPETGANFAVLAGYVAAREYSPEHSLTIKRIGTDDPSAPLSVFGSLTLGAANVIQEGVVRAPLGRIQLGTEGGLNGRTESVVLAPGSVTSVSAAGLVVPYGGTVDGIKYLYGNEEVELADVGDVRRSGISLRGDSVVGMEESLLDLSGGGELTGAGFISGRGGSTDVRFNPLMVVNADGEFSLPSLQDRSIYAIVPRVHSAAAPVQPEAGASAAMVGQQITVPAGVPGLPAGVYTLLPSTYALLPGAFRVELGDTADLAGIRTQPIAMRNGSYAVGIYRSVANTDIRDALPIRAFVTAADTARKYSQYNETGYSQFVLDNAARLSQPRAMLPADGRALELYYPTFASTEAREALDFAGTAIFTAAESGYGGQLVVQGASHLEVRPDAGQSTPGMTSVSADALNAFAAPRMVIGGALSRGNFAGSSDRVVIRQGAELRAAEVFLVTNGDAEDRGITVEAGASINTIGQGKAIYDSRDGYLYDPGSASVLAVSNGWVDLLPPKIQSSQTGGDIDLGGCYTPGLICSSGDTQIYSEGTIALATLNRVEVRDNVRYGTRNLSFALPSVNIGSDAALASAATSNALPPGLRLSQPILSRLLNGNPDVGAPALERLIFSAGESINFYGSADLDTRDPATGELSLAELVFNSPAIYGAGSADDTVTLTTGKLVWNGIVDGIYRSTGTGNTSPNSRAPGAVLAGGAGTGTGTFNVVADEIVLGYSDQAFPDTELTLDRLMLGFSTVNFQATRRITANNKGSLSVYRSQGEFDSGTGTYAYTGGNLNLITPLLTGAAGSVSTLIAGGDLSVVAPDGVLSTATSDSLGATVNLKAGAVRIASTVALPSGKLTLAAEDDIELQDGSHIDLSGRAVDFFDVTRYGWGGDLVMESAHGNILQAASSVIDVSADKNNAGTVQVAATDLSSGRVALDGTILGSTTNGYTAGGIDVRAVSLGAGGLSADFADLNTMLNTGGVFGARSFSVKEGDLTIGDGLTASKISVAVDGGSLTVNGAINASGDAPGTIRLSALQDLTITGSGRLDAHSNVLRVDSDGQSIEASNRAHIELTTSKGTLTLGNDSVLDVRSADGVNRGAISLNVPRLGSDGSPRDAATYGDIAIDARGAISILGARSIVINAMQDYDDADYGTEPSAGNRPYQVIDQDYLDAKHSESNDFMVAAMANIDLVRGKLAGLNNSAYRDALHLRPGIEIVSASPDGDLLVQGDLDLSRYRYDSGSDFGLRKLSGRLGSGEPGSLVMRASGDLHIYGSINDGFAFGDGVTTPDQNGWVLKSGVEPFGSDIILPKAIVLKGMDVNSGTATTFAVGVDTVLNYDIAIQPATIKENVLIPMAVEVNSPDGFLLPAGTVLRADIQRPGLPTLAKGTVLQQAEIVPQGSSLGAGTRLPMSIDIAAVTVPKGTSLNIFAGTFGSPYIALGADAHLPLGAVIPAGANLQFGGADEGAFSIALRDAPSQVWAVAPILPQGSQSWDLRLVAGADTTSADTRALRTKQSLSGVGNVVLSDLHYMEEAGGFQNPLIFSVVRTGTGSLDILAGGDYSQASLFGVYTAGQAAAPVLDADGRDPYNLDRGVGSSKCINFGIPEACGAILMPGLGSPDYERLASELYSAWYPENGGDLSMRVQGNMAGLIANGETNSSYVGNWLWRQAGPDASQPAAWWINFGSYVFGDSFASLPRIAGFSGMGTLGGGNVSIHVDGDAGIMASRGFDESTRQSQGLNLAVASTGRVGRDGTLHLTGGGELDLRVGGAVNPLTPYANASSNRLGDAGLQNDFNGTLVNLRGDINVVAGAIGRIEPIYNEATNRFPDPRGFVPAEANSAHSTGGMVIVPGDGEVRLSTRGDLVVGGAGDAGRMDLINEVPYTNPVTGQYVAGGGRAGFTLWTENTSLQLVAAGGNVTPSTQPKFGARNTGNDQATDFGYYVYPGSLLVTALSDSIFLGMENASDVRALLLAPAPKGQLEFLAARSIFGGDDSGSLPVHMSGAAMRNVATPRQPAFMGIGLPATFGGSSFIPDYDNTKYAASTIGGTNDLLAFGDITADGQLHAADTQPARFYAVSGDIVGLRTGEVRTFSAGIPGIQQSTWYVAAKPVWMLAGRDIVGADAGLPLEDGAAPANLFVHNNSTDVSMVRAGRDIWNTDIAVAGPGLLEVIAGRNLNQADQASLASLGPIGSTGEGDRTGGAGISVIVGAGVAGPDYAAFAARYLDPANLADPALPLDDTENADKVAKTYETELLEWVRERFEYEGDLDGALAYFLSLPAEQQRIFVRSVYFDELRAGGREFNDPDSRRFGSYLRGREAIATLFPQKDAAGKPISYEGDVTLYGNSGIRTLFGGDVQVLTPGGQQIYGLEGTASGASSGVTTQGSGDIQMYSQGSILLGQSRVMTTYGGNVQAWSAQGDINAGRGSKTTVVYPPARRTYSDIGNVTIAPVVPSTGAGFATINPIPEVPPGDMDLVAPLGTVDLGEAGVRVSGSINVAALHVANAANLQVQGEVMGLPTVAAVNVGALTAASTSVSSAVTSAQEMTRQQQRASKDALPSIFTVKILGFGPETPEEAAALDREWEQTRKEWGQAR